MSYYFLIFVLLMNFTSCGKEVVQTGNIKGDQTPIPLKSDEFVNSKVFYHLMSKEWCTEVSFLELCEISTRICRRTSEFAKIRFLRNGEYEVDGIYEGKWYAFKGHSLKLDTGKDEKFFNIERILDLTILKSIQGTMVLENCNE